MKVGELTDLIKTRLEQDFPFVQVEGEISNYRPSSTGHVYFSLKDEKALISAVLFRSQASRLNFRPADGQLVQVTGRISVYPPRGGYQIVCQSMTPVGEGNLLQILEERKQRLAAEGLFEESRKKPLPLFPERVALVTSPTGAAVRDILQVMERRGAGSDITLFPCPVQGEGAAEKIARQIARVNEYALADVIICGRGGGSLEDLLPFSEECVVRAIADSEIPVISGVGHEIDFSLADFAADYRAPTPSAAAEVVSAQESDIRERIALHRHLMINEIEQRLEKIRLIIQPFTKEELERSFYTYLEPLMMKLDDEKEKLTRAVKERLDEQSHALALAKKDLEASSPLAVLERGFARVSDEEGNTVFNTENLEPGATVTLRFYEGKADAEIKEIKK
ncbi:MAG: exodeoxyribonuclease VII large subunit [Spirochaetales bacterium]|nr:exodeoxyribonuclease VII large subunit [Spirochaetales bacterium]